MERSPPFLIVPELIACGWLGACAPWPALRLLHNAAGTQEYHFINKRRTELMRKSKKNKAIRHLYDVELSEKELLSLGLIVSQWGCLEHEIFFQTLNSFPPEGGKNLPKAMNNVHFSDVLDLWEERVVNRASKTRKLVLTEQLRRIRHCQDFRNAIAHGMWEWDQSDPKTIHAIRIRKKDIITTHFNADDLHDFSIEIAEINFSVRFPAGLKDLAKAMAEAGSYISRKGVALLSGSPIAADLFPRKSKTASPNPSKIGPK